MRNIYMQIGHGTCQFWGEKMYYTIFLYKLQFYFFNCCGTLKTLSKLQLCSKETLKLKRIVNSK
jgi:hypothetical protein